MVNIMRVGIAFKILKIISIKPMNLSNISRQISSCSNYVNKTMKKMLEIGLVEEVGIKKDKRSRYFIITEKGEKLKELLIKIAQELNSASKNWFVGGVPKIR